MPIGFVERPGLRFAAITSDNATGGDVFFDLDLDGDDDLLVFESAFPPNADRKWPARFFERDGGTFAETSDAVVGAPPPRSKLVRALVEDFNGDGLPDVFMGDFGYDGARQTGATNGLLLGRADGTLKDASGRLPSIKTLTYDVTAADVDRDGDLDVLDLTLAPFNGILAPRMLLNTGAARFRSTTKTLPESFAETITLGGETYRETTWYSATFLDVDGRKGPDLVVGPEFGSNDGRAMLFYNDGKGGFSDKRSAKLPKARLGDDVAWERMEAADLDGDGRDELVALIDAGLGVQWGLRIFTANAKGRLKDVTDKWTPGTETEGPGGQGYQLQLLDIDIDFDGDVDILLPGMPNDSPILWLNDGTGRFREAFNARELGLWTPNVIPRLNDAGSGYDLYNIFARGPADGGPDLLMTPFELDADRSAPLALKGGGAPDILTGGRHGDVLNGAGAADILMGRGGDDTLRGANGDDRLKGGEGDDMLTGGRGTDRLSGGAGEDVLRGGGGRDRLSGGEGVDDLTGGGGADVFIFAPGGGVDRALDLSAKDVVNLRAFGLADRDAFLAAVTPGGLSHVFEVDGAGFTTAFDPAAIAEANLLI